MICILEFMMMRMILLNGNGILTETKGKQAGEVYTGIWKNGKKNGNFIFKDKSGKKRKELWKEDKFIKFI